MTITAQQAMSLSSNVYAMRPFLNKKGQARILTPNAKGVQPVQNAALRYDEWKMIDEEVVSVATDRLVGIADLRSSNLVKNLGGIGVTISQWEELSNMDPAHVDMEGDTEGQKDSLDFDLTGVPVPVIHKSFRIGMRRLEASRRNGESLDTTHIGVATRIVAEGAEDLLFGSNLLTVAGNTLYGYLTHPNRNTATMTTDWAAVASANNSTIVDEVLEMIAACNLDGFRGPFNLYVPGEYETKLAEDLKAESEKTIAQRIQEINSIASIRYTDRLAQGNVVLVQMTKDVVDLALGQDIIAVNWSNNGGMTEDYKVMGVMAPRLKQTYTGQCGFCHLS